LGFVVQTARQPAATNQRAASTVTPRCADSRGLELAEEAFLPAREAHFPSINGMVDFDWTTRAA